MNLNNNNNSSTDRFVLENIDGQLQLRKTDEPKLGAIFVDFTHGAVDYRRKFGGGRRQAIAKAVGLKKGATPIVVDATAGLGRDAFVLASLGCQVYMVERNNIIAALLEDGLARAVRNVEIGQWVVKRLKLFNQDSWDFLKNMTIKPDVIYLDPMYPDKKKSALVKKEMRILRELLGDDLDSKRLFVVALTVAQNRVVVKRPAYAPYLTERVPDTSLKTTKNRFDLYIVS